MSEINWRTIVAARYDDNPHDERVGRVLAALTPEVRIAVAVAFDYKGILMVAWKGTPTDSQMQSLEAAWQTIGYEDSSNVEHYALTPVKVGALQGFWGCW